MLREDASSEKPRFPQVTAHALERNDALAEAVQVRLKEDEELHAIRALPYNFFTGTIPLVFEFRAGRSRGHRPEILAMIDSDCRLCSPPAGNARTYSTLARKPMSMTPTQMTGIE